MSVRIQKIIVKKLFGKFNYDLNLDNGYDVSILIGGNGSGKTTIFNLIDFIFNPIFDKYLKIKDIPFNEFKCVLSSGKTLRLYREESKTQSANPSEEKKDLFFDDGNVNGAKIDEYLTSYIQDRIVNQDQIVNNDKIDFWEYRKNTRNKIRTLRNNFIHLPIGFSRSLDDEYQENISFYRNLMNLDEKEYNSLLSDSKIIFKIFNDVEHEIKINYIPSNRLYDVKKDNEVVESLSKIKKDVIEIFNKANEEYNKGQSKAKNEILKRYIKGEDKQLKIKNEESYMKLWKDYIKDFKEYSKIGLIDSDIDVLERFNNQEALYDDLKSNPFFNIYINAFEDTLKQFDDFYNKFSSFIDILNERNKASGKTFAFSREKGIVFSVDGNNLPLECMSSGEKNDFIMFYNLIFNSADGGVVLIDEPEISLHIAWQDTVVDRMLDICEKNKLQAIIATHSPHIINGYNDLILKGGPTK